MSKPNILILSIPGMISDSDLSPLREFATVEYVETSPITQDEAAQLCVGFDHLMLNMDSIISDNGIKLGEAFYSSHATDSIRSISVDMTGVDYFSPLVAKKHGVLLQNIPHYSSRSVAESIISEILLHSRQRHMSYMDQCNERASQARRGFNLLNRRAAVIGYGSIGKEVCSLLSCLGMEVVVWNRTPRQGLDLIPLNEAFASSDIVVLSLATVLEGEEKTEHFVNDELLSLCSSSIIINLANERLVDNTDMFEALMSGRVEAYSVEASDLTREVLGGIEQVHFAPHNAWNSNESMEELRAVWVSNAISVIQGSPNNVVTI